MLDDLRDYRFYATDMKHPSDTAADYIYKQSLKLFLRKTVPTPPSKHDADTKQANTVRYYDT